MGTKAQQTIASIKEGLVTLNNAITPFIRRGSIGLK